MFLELKTGLVKRGAKYLKKFSMERTSLMACGNTEGIAPYIITTLKAVKLQQTWTEDRFP